MYNRDAPSINRRSSINNFAPNGIMINALGEMKIHHTQATNKGAKIANPYFINELPPT